MRETSRPGPSPEALRQWEESVSFQASGIECTVIHSALHVTHVTSNSIQVERNPILTLIPILFHNYPTPTSFLVMATTLEADSGSSYARMGQPNAAPEPKVRPHSIRLARPFHRHRSRPHSTSTPLHYDQYDTDAASLSTRNTNYINNNHDMERSEALLAEQDDNKEEVYIVRQKYGYFSWAFSVTQTAILGIMMWQCGIAPMRINPMFGPYPDALSEWGGKNSVLILEDAQWWRLLTPILLHAGVIHLLCNVAVQIEAGAFFEQEWGSFRWLVVYLASAVGSSILSVIVMPNAVSVGSSGALMGLFGAKLAEVTLRVCDRADTEQQRVAHQVRKEQCTAVTCSVLLVMLFSFIPYVDWAAHLGGLVAGFAVGILLFANDIAHRGYRLCWILVGLATTFALFATSLRYMYSGAVAPTEELRDVCGYYTQNFDNYQCNCMREEYLNTNDGANAQDRS